MGSNLAFKLLTLESMLCAKGARGRKQLKKGMCASAYIIIFRRQQLHSECGNYIPVQLLGHKYGNYILLLCLHMNIWAPHFGSKNLMAFCRHGIPA